MTTTEAVTRAGEFAELMYTHNIAPWDIGESQPVIRQLAALGVLRGEVLDAGCGTGWHTIEFARSGCKVTGIDIAPTAIARARRNALAAGITANFKTGDVITTLDRYPGRFDAVVDSKLLDNLTPEDRVAYLAALHRATRPSAKLFLYAFGPGDINGVHNHEPETIDFERLLAAAGFTVTYTGPTTFELTLKEHKPVCRRCPRSLPVGRMHIPMIEIHASRNTTTKGTTS